MKRQPFITRKFILSGTGPQQLAIACINHVPLDFDMPLEVLVREQVKARKQDQNSLMWVGPLADIEEQAYVEGRTYSAEVWHEWAKREFLPEEDDRELGLLVKDGYRKWDTTPSGERVLVGSTTQLTVRGFSHYMEKLYAHGASLGVKFRERGNAREIDHG